MQYVFKVKRSVTHAEELDVVVNAKNQKEAEKIAARFGEGDDPCYPHIFRYTVSSRSPVGVFELTGVTHVKDVE